VRGANTAGARTSELSRGVSATARPERYRAA
jgi:hypothetical protein